VAVKRAPGKSHCPINFALEAFGDPWSLLVVRDITYFGKHTFTEFLASEEAIAPGVLSSRLSQLTAAGILVKRRSSDDGRQLEYNLTERGLGLIPVLLEIAKWSAGVDPDTDAPPEWIATVERHKPEVTAMIVDTVRRGGGIFVGDNSVVAQLAGRNDTVLADAP
jgi:DNA-binding HxlR family transcriptional regulator